MYLLTIRSVKKKKKNQTWWTFYKLVVVLEEINEMRHNSYTVVGIYK